MDSYTSFRTMRSFTFASHGRTIAKLLLKLRHHTILNMLAMPVVLQMARILSNADLAGFYESYYAAKGIKLIKKQLAKELKGENGKVGHKATRAHNV